MASQRSRSLTPSAIRSHLAATLAFGIGLALLLAVTAPAYSAAAKAIAGGLNALAIEATPVAKSFQFLTGPADRLDTIGGYLSYKVFPSITLLLAIYAAIQGSQLIRGAETKGVFELWFAAGKTRNQIIRERLLGFIASLSAILLFLYVGTVVGGALSGVQLAASALGQCLAVGMVSMVGFAVGLFLAQFFATSRLAAGIASAFLVATYLVANVSGSLGAFSFLSFVSPFHYYMESRTLIPGTALDVIAIAELAVATVVLVAVAWCLYLQRDTDGVTLARIHRTRAADYTFRPSRILRRTLWLGWIAEQPVAIASWFIGIAAFTAMEAALVPQAMHLLDSNANLTKFMAQHGGILTSDQYVGFLMTFTGVFAAAFTVSQVARWVGDAVDHRNDVLLTQPVSMARLLVERAVALVWVSAFIGLAVVMGTLTGAAIGGFSVHLDGVARTFGDIVLLCFAVGGVGTLAATVFRSAAATAIIAGILVASFFLTTIVSLFSWPAWASRPSVFDAFGSPYTSMPGTGSLIYLAGLGVIGTAAAYLAMRRGLRVVA